MIDIYKAGIYIRLSKEDIRANNKESESIINQRNLIMRYLKDNNLELEKEYVDDGYSGTTFDRPAFNQLIKDIESKKINMVITKDLSRLGRDYIKSGYYLEQYFPMNNVRYISILDNIDTSIDTTNNDIAPFKALFNDMLSKDNSKKIRSILRDKKKQGLFLGTSAAYGYKKEKNNKYHLVIDSKSSKIVKKIFHLRDNGYSIKEIVDYLNERNIRTPQDYKNNTYLSKWTSTKIYQILHNKVYTGVLVQGKQSKLSYKSKKRIILDKTNWIIVENAHEPIISKELFERVNRVNNKKSKRQEKKLLEGLIYCKDCGSLMSIKKDYRSNKDNFSINCNRYSRNPKEFLCTSHFTKYNEVEGVVLKILNNSLEKTVLKIDRDLIRLLINRIEISKNKQINIYFNFNLHT